MSSFLKKLKGKGIVEEEVIEEEDAPHESEAPAGAVQLPVDVYQSDSEIIIFAQIAGADVSTLDVSIEGENDVITIQGMSHRPEDLADIQRGEDGHTPHGEYSLEESSWGEFFRQIILPEEVDAENAEAKVKDGVLILKMSLKNHNDNKIRMNVVKVDSHHS